MADGTGIEWTDATWNPLRGCTRISEGCRNCYAETVAARFSGPGQPYEGLAKWVTTPDGGREARWTGDIELIEKALDQPLRWKRPRKIFVNSMSDLFHESVPDEWIDKVFAVMALAPQHTFQVLTKRPERMRTWFAKHDAAHDHNTADRVADQIARMLGRDGAAGADRVDARWAGWPLPNVWLGVSVEDQKTADARIPILLDTPAAVRWISAEPLLGPIDLEPWLHWPDPYVEIGDHIWGCADCEDRCRECPNSKAHYQIEEGPKNAEGVPTWITHERVTLDQVIVGMESGPNARPGHPDWARSIRDQCAAAGTPFLFKQWGEFAPGSDLHYGAGTVCVDRQGRIVPAPARAADFPPDASHAEGWTWMRRVGKKAAGRLLDGVLHDGYPEVRANG